MLITLCNYWYCLILLIVNIVNNPGRKLLNSKKGKACFK